MTVLGNGPFAQISSIRFSGLNIQILSPVILPGGEVQQYFTGGTRPSSEVNLLSTFGEFEVPTNNIANFLNDSSLLHSQFSNRVTSGNPSNILGMIQTTESLGNANLFLMNPVGIVFGQDAQVHVGGAVYFSTAGICDFLTE